MKTKYMNAVSNVMDAMWKVRFLLGGMALSAAMATQKMCASAAAKTKATKAPARNADQELDFLKNGSTNGAFDKMTNVTKQTGNSLIELLRTAGIIGIVVAVLLCAISYAMSKNPQVKEMNKGWALQICVSGAIIFGVLGIVSMIASIGMSI